MCILLLLLLAGWELLGSLPCCLAIANDNPEIEGTSNAAKDPGLGKRDDPTTQSHASYLKTLSEQAQDPSAFEEKITGQKPRNGSMR